MRALAHRPDILVPFVQFYWQLQTTGLLDRKLITTGSTTQTSPCCTSNSVLDEGVEPCMDVALFIGIGRTFAVIDAMNNACETPGARERVATAGS